MHVQAWLERAARTVPDVVAIEAGEPALSYAELLDGARAGAEELSIRGVLPQDRVAIALPAGVGFAKALHACFLLGAVAVPIDLRLSAAERRAMVADAVALVEEPLPEHTRGRASKAGAPQTAGGNGAQRRPARTVADCGHGARHDLDATAVVIHTSGTTSQPKPIELTYGNLLWSALGSGVAMGVDPAERWLCALPLSHVGGLSILIRSAIYGTTAVIHERFETERVLDALSSERITLVSLVATTLARLLDAGLREPPDLRCALTGGGPVPEALVARARQAGVAVRETYGLTECCSQAATSPAGGDARGAGVPLFCTRVEIARDGEILLSGPTIAPGSIAADGRLHTGDLGHIEESGFLHVTGRKADTIVTGGENVAPAEVEAVLEAHPSVVEAAVVGRADPQWGEAVTAILVAAAGADPDEAQLREHCAASLAPYKVPKHYVLVGDPLPRTPAGKLLRRRLR
jgi:o-succinylbenzoate---CoA ligase